MAEQVRGITVRLSEEAYWGYRRFSFDTEISVSALLEAGGLVWGHPGAYGVPELPPHLCDAIVERARTSDYERRRRPEGRTPLPRALNVRLSEEAREGWDYFCRRNSVPLASVVEAFGLLLGEGGADMVKDFPITGALARDITSGRRKRKTVGPK